MGKRTFTAAILMAIAASGAASQDLQIKGPRDTGPDPFRLERGSTFSASSAVKRKAAVPTTPASSVVTDIQEALTVIRQNHVSKPASGQLTRSSVEAMLKSLDPHSSYYDRSEYAELLDEQRSEYFGTGSSIADYEREGKFATYILSVFPGTSAERAGLKFGDRIVAVNGRPVEDAGSKVIRDLMRGPKGTAVSMTFERAGKTFTVSLKRDKVPQKTVTDHFMLGDGVGLIRMPEGFSFTSFEEFDAAFQQLKADGMTSLVFDLRGNPGGILDQSIKIAEKFLPEGSVIVSQRGRFPIDNRVWKSTNRSPETLPVVVMVDGDSASAAEVVAGTLQDNDRAVIVGEKTFGKGLVQSVIDLPSGGGLTLTTARYFTPSGRSLQRDYEHNGTYDYYNHAAGTAVATKPSLTRTKREVYGGDGITPDIKAPAESVTRERIALLDPIFHFARELAANARVLSEEDHFSEFREFARRGWGVQDQTVARNKEFIEVRLAHYLELASGGPTNASRVLLKNDQQVAKAVQAMPQAVSFASSYYVSKTPARK
jgi:carboxyl-terminal processing protease